MTAIPPTPAANRPAKPPLSGCRLLLFCALALLLPGGCQLGLQAATPMLPMAEVARGADESARLSLFLNLLQSDGPGVRLEISELEILVGDGWLPLIAGPLELDSEAIAATQLFLGGRTMAPGRYQGLRFTVEKLSLRRESGHHASLIQKPLAVELEFPAAVVLEDDDSRSLFLTWDVQGTLEQSNEPVINIAPQIKQMLADLIYVACPDIDTIFVIRSDRNWVADSFGIKGRPTYLALAPDAASRRLYVLAARENAIKVVDLASQRVIDFLHLPLAENPTFMAISPDGNWAYILEEQGSYLSRIDLTTGRSAVRVRVGYRPQFAVYLAEQNLLAVSSGLSQAVSLRNPLTLGEVGTILTGNSPQGLLEADGLLYITESGDHTLAIFDFATNRSRSRLEVGFGPRRLVVAGDYIYLSNYESDSLSVLLPGQQGVLREIRGLGGPLEMIYDQDRRWLYVGEERTGSLAVIDPTVNQLVGRIKLGARPLGLVVIP